MGKYDYNCIYSQIHRGTQAMTTITAQEIENCKANFLTKKDASQVVEINNALAALEAAIETMKTFNDKVNHFVWDNAIDGSYLMPLAEHAKIQEMLLWSPSEQPNGLDMRHWKGDKFPVSNWIAHTKNIYTHIKRLQAEYDAHKDNGIVVSWWVD